MVLFCDMSQIQNCQVNSSILIFLLSLCPVRSGRVGYFYVTTARNISDDYEHFTLATDANLSGVLSSDVRSKKTKAVKLSRK